MFGGIFYVAVPSVDCKLSVALKKVGTIKIVCWSQVQFACAMKQKM